MWDFDEDDCDCGLELGGGEHYGCDRCECCEDCPHVFECDGCGNLIGSARANAPRRISPQKSAGKSAARPSAPKKPEEKAPVQPNAPEVPPIQKQQPKKTVAIVVGTLFLVACLILSLFI